MAYLNMPKKYDIIECEIKCDCGSFTWIVKQPGEYMVHAECESCGVRHGLLITKYKRVAKLLRVRVDPQEITMKLN
jgi:hypothetical protein